MKIGHPIPMNSDGTVSKIDGKVCFKTLTGKIIKNLVVQPSDGLVEIQTKVMDKGENLG